MGESVYNKIIAYITIEWTGYPYTKIHRLELHGFLFSRDSSMVSWLFVQWRTSSWRAEQTKLFTTCVKNKCVAISSPSSYTEGTVQFCWVTMANGTLIYGIVFLCLGLVTLRELTQTEASSDDRPAMNLSKFSGPTLKFFYWWVNIFSRTPCVVLFTDSISTYTTQLLIVNLPTSMIQPSYSVITNGNPKSIDVLLQPSGLCMCMYVMYTRPLSLAFYIITLTVTLTRWYYCNNYILDYFSYIWPAISQCAGICKG